MSDLYVKIFFVVLLLLVGVVGSGDAESERIEYAKYIDDVCDGRIPDFKEINPEC